MAQIIEGDDLTFMTLAFGGPNRRTVDAIQSRLTRLDRSRYLDNSFLDELYSTYDRLGSYEALEYSRNLMQSTNHYHDPNLIRYLDSLEAIQTAELRMQDYVMAEPNIRRLYQQQRCDGYSDSYFDVEPNAIGEDHFHYRQVNDGILHFVDEDDETMPSDVTYYVDTWLSDDDDELMFNEQVDILKTWDLMQILINQGKDPTSVYGNSL